MTPVRFGTAQGRWVIVATVLASGIVFLDSTVVNVALPAIRADLGVGVTTLQWILNGYLVTLTALMLLGGSVGDIVGRRRVLVWGLFGFAAASIACGLAPSGGALIAARAMQGAAGAFLVPGSLSVVSATFDAQDRGRAIGAWSGLAGVASAIGPFIGGWLIDTVSWRLIFLINIPLIAIAVWIANVHVPETRDEEASSIDWAGAATATIGLAGVSFALIEGPSGGGPAPMIAGLIGALALVAFVAIESRVAAPMLPLGLFSSSQFTGANLTTLFVYASLGGAFFLLVLHLQVSLSYSALAAGISLLPVTILMLALSSRAAALAQRIGPRLPMTAGPLIASAGLISFARIHPGASYVSTVLPAVGLFGAGLTLTVAPLTAAVLASVDERHVGSGSGVNNAVARLGGLIAIAVLPSITGLEDATPASVAKGFGGAMRICAATCAIGGVVAFLTVRSAAKVRPVVQASTVHPCGDPCLSDVA